MKKEFDNFDEFAKNYRDIHNENIKISGATSDYFAEYKIAEVRRFEPANTSLNILDVGCGDGISAVFFNKFFKGHSYTGIDVSEESIAEAKNRKEPNASFVPYDGFNIPFPDNHFDMVFFACVLHHIRPEHHVQLLTECRRVLKPGGRVYIFEHNPYNPLTLKVVRDCVFDKDAILLKPGYCKSMVGEAGFKNRQNRFTLFFPRVSFFKKILGLEKLLSWFPLGGQYFTRAVK